MMTSNHSEWDPGKAVLASAILLLSAAASVCALDPRYRTYGKLNHPVGSQTLPFREGANGYSAQADFITVGKLDGNTVGPYKAYTVIDEQGGTHADIARIHGEFNALESCNRAQRASGTAGEQAATLTTDGCKEKVLLQQFNEECNRNQDGKCQSLVDWAAAWSNHHPGDPVFEIANEPNVFPYMSPETYAWYYALWHDEIKKVKPNAKVMNGGLWCFQGLPQFIRSNLSLLGVSHNPDINAELDYFTNFIRYLKVLKPATWQDYRPDILNLHFYPYVDIIADNSPLTASGGYGGNTGMIWINMLARFLALNKVIVEGNKHTKTQEVWLTEVGNINPIPETHAKVLMDEIFLGLEGADLYKAVFPTHARVKRWYWFMATGSDSKFDAITKYDWYIRQYGKLMSAYYNIYTKLPGAHLMVQILADLYAWYKDIKVPSISMLMDAVTLADKIVVNGVPQGLEYEHNHALSQLGTRYLALANKPYVPPASVGGAVEQPESCRTWMKKCDAITIFGWKIGTQNCSTVEVAIPCAAGKIPAATSLMLLD